MDVTEEENEEKPIIGVTGPDDGGWVAWVMTAYAVRRAGGKPLRLRPSRPVSIEKIHGLVLGGGADVDLSLHGGEQENIYSEMRVERERLKRYFVSFLFFPLLYFFRKAFSCSEPIRDEARDSFEGNLIDQAVARGLPMLGLCRGALILNLYFGGTLHEDIGHFYHETADIRTILPKKKVILRQGSRLSSTLKTDSCTVNAYRHEELNSLGQDLEMTAWEMNKNVQAFEHRTLPFVVGVQWHPEYLSHTPRQRALFRALVYAAVQAANTGGQPLESV